MEKFVTELKKNINEDSKTVRNTNFRFREVLYYVSQAKPEVNIIDQYNEYGDVKFEVSLQSLGITPDILVKYEKEIYSDFMANLLGELIIRENLNDFASILTDINSDIYPSVVERFEHLRFGMDINKNKLIFSFHLSLLQDILIEDVRKKIK
jgi:hypothetical protein